jgi:L-lactate dehydrogenase complex protein LldG
MTANLHRRRTILDRLSSWPIEPPPLPQLDPGQLIQFDNPLARFVETLQLVGGQAHLLERGEQAAEVLQAIPAFASAQRVASLLPELVAGNVEVAASDDPHGLDSLDWVIAPGEFLVAENAAIWVDGATLPLRVMLFIPQYLALVVSRRQIVQHMHEAYARIGQPKPGFGVFVSGPSKTADIEQSLVLGAHGCRTLQVLLLP